MTKKFEEVKSDIIGILKQNKNPLELKHAENALGWLLKLSPNANELSRIAIIGHDIDRSFPPRTLQSQGESYEDYKRRHSTRSAEIIAKIMRKYGYNKGSIGKAVHLIKNHEVGGDKLTNLIRDADSISYFDNNIDWYLKNKGLEKTKEKVTWMFKRASKRAKKYIKELNFNPYLKTELRS